MPSHIQIVDEDIQEIGAKFDCDFSDDSRRQALLRTTSMDVQACPGSGKTTLLVAKLAILAKKWRWRDRGIIVLSHTNVARSEVEKRLARHPYAHKLLAYPHFIGTIQRFIDEFLALAFLKDAYGVSKPVIDDDRFAERASSDLERRYKLKKFLNPRHNGEEVARTARFEYTENGLCLGCGSGNYPFNDTTWESYKEFEALKTDLTTKGYVRYDDMFAFACERLNRSPALLEAIRMRFPWVFIDEMQDTSFIQDSVLQRAFKRNCVVQRFGDINQAIFGSGKTDAQQSFPGDGMIDLSQSKRFGRQIAHLCSPASSVACQILEGNDCRMDLKNSIILFDEPTISEVLPTFGRLIFKEIGRKADKPIIAKVIGFRKRPREVLSGKYLPHDIADYWPQFDNTLTKKVDGENYLLEYVAKARFMLAATKECREPYSLILEGLLRLAEELQLIDCDGGRITKPGLLRNIKCSPYETRKRFDSIMHNFCIGSTPLRADTWTIMGKEAAEFMIKLYPLQKPANPKSFINWDDRFAVPVEIENANLHARRNIYPFRENGFECDLEVTTIHSVKGETHDATLVLETCFNRGHDLRKTLPFLVADGNDCTAANDDIKEHLKRIYVAMTRPRELLCLALLENHLGASPKARCDIETKLKDKGWQVIHLTKGGKETAKKAIRGQSLFLPGM